MDALSQVTFKGGEHVIVAVCALLGHENPAVRRTAVEALVQVSWRNGDDSVVAVLGRHLEHHDAAVRRQAVRALAQVTAPGDECHWMHCSRICLAHSECLLRVPLRLPTSPVNWK